MQKSGQLTRYFRSKNNPLSKMELFRRWLRTRTSQSPETRHAHGCRGPDGLARAAAPVSTMLLVPEILELQSLGLKLLELSSRAGNL